MTAEQFTFRLVNHWLDFSQMNWGSFLQAFMGEYDLILGIQSRTFLQDWAEQRAQT